jgi:DNA-binding CsgD family transcriptional regulator
VTPLTRFADLHPAPVLREPAALGDPTGRTDPNLTLLGIPHQAIPRLTGWRQDFATTPPHELAAALGRHTARITGPRIAPAAQTLSFWAHTVVESSVTMTVLLPGDRFESRPIANLDPRWRHVTYRMPRRWRGAHVVALSFTGVSTIAQDGVEVGPIEQRGGPGTPAQLTSMRDWVSAALTGQVLPSGLVGAPIPRGVRISFFGAAVPLIRPGYTVPRALPAIVSSRLAKQAVDGQLAIVARGRRIPLDIVGTSDLFPGITTRPAQFAVADYATLLAVLDADAPGDANAQEAWSTSGLAPPRSRLENLLPGGHMVTTAAERAVARHDALAVGLDALLLIAALLAGLLVVAGLAALGEGRHADAFGHLRRVFDPVDPAHHPVIRTWAIGDLVEAAVQSGHRAEAGALVQELEPLAGAGASPFFQMTMAYAHALLADGDSAEPHFRAALDASASRWPLYRARIELQYGTWLRRRRRASESRSPLRAARDTFDALGASPWSERARQELRASGERERSGRGFAACDQLSPQELQVAQMAAEGMSNREIGQRLCLSPRTVGSHLYRAFPKLGVTSRGQLHAALAPMSPPVASETVNPDWTSPG